MKASDLILELQELINKYGDKEVVYLYSNDNHLPMNHIWWCEISSKIIVA